ncbi:MAG: hypothetical protein V5A44_10910 [Haloarculaceae archaeon]
MVLVAVLLAATPVAGAVSAPSDAVEAPAGSVDTADTGGAVDSVHTDEPGDTSPAKVGGHTGAARGDRFVSDAVAARRFRSQVVLANATVTDTGGHASASGTAVLETAPRSVSVTQRIALTPDRPGEVRVTHTFEVPGTVTSLRAPVPERANVTATTGFRFVEGTEYAWDGNTTRARITYALPADETVSQAGPEGAQGRYLLVDAGRWALVRQPRLAASWRWQGPEPVGLTSETTVAGPGYVGEQLVYLGAVETRERRAHGQTFTLVVPDRARMTASPDAVLDALADASDRLRVGDRDERVTAVVAPTTTTVDWGVRGLQLGDSDFWVRDVEPLGGPDDVWLHEYVHTRQSFETAPSGRWLTEATATYYAALLALERNETDFASFREFLGRGAMPPQSGAILAEPCTWDNAANYWKGALVAAAIDRRIRVETDATRSFGTAFSRLNAFPRPVDRAVTLELLRRVGGSALDEFAGTYVATSRVPPAWSASEHEAAFGPTPARFTFRFADRASDRTNATDEGGLTGNRENVTVGFRVSGPYRNETLTGSPLTLYAGETLHATGVVVNAGGASAPYEQFFAVGGSVQRLVSGALAPGETATHALDVTVETTGRRTVSFGADSVEVAVYDPAPARLGAVTVNRTTLPRPGVVAVNVTVVNPYAVPARRNVTVTRAGESVWSRRVGVAAGANRTLTVPVRLRFSGQYAVGVGGGPEATVTVGGGSDDGAGTGTSTRTIDARVGEATADGGETASPAGDVTAGNGSGFGALSALGALVVLVALAVGPGIRSRHDRRR